MHLLSPLYDRTSLKIRPCACKYVAMYCIYHVYVCTYLFCFSHLFKRSAHSAVPTLEWAWIFGRLEKPIRMQIKPKLNLEVPKTFQNRPPRLENRPWRPQEAPKSVQERSKTRSGSAQDHPSDPSRLPTGAQEGPKTGPRGSKIEAKT